VTLDAANLWRQLTHPEDAGEHRPFVYSAYGNAFAHGGSDLLTFFRSLRLRQGQACVLGLPRRLEQPHGVARGVRIADSPRKTQTSPISRQTAASRENCTKRPKEGKFGANMWSSCPYMPTILAYCCWQWYNRIMIVSATGRYVRREFAAVLVCLSLIGNSAYGTVLCFGTDGHVEFESAFHAECKDHAHSQSTDHGRHSSEAEHKHDKHCHSGQCVDVPISFGLAKVSKTPGQLTLAFAALAADMIASVEQSDCSEHLPASDAFIAGSYFSPLRTVILLA